MTTDDFKATKIALFKGKKIRKILHNDEWWFSVVDVVEALTGSSIPRRYWSDLKIKVKQEGFGEVYEKIVQLKLEAPDGKKRKTDCANTEIFHQLSSDQSNFL